MMGLYSETTWAVGIAQLTHHSVRGGGKNPSTGVAFILHFIWVTICIFFKAWQFLKTAKEYINLGDGQRPLN